jgi:hypothetical protein
MWYVVVLRGVALAGAYLCACVAHEKNGQEKLQRPPDQVRSSA